MNVEDRQLEEITQKRYLSYALSVVRNRALPDVRDGLKPVQRRILYAMWDEGLTHDTKHRKSASVVGEVLGNYHPHGDKSVYDALVRMAQDFNTRLPLIDGWGNFGSVDGDPAAAMRYTEARLSEAATPVLNGISDDTVPFQDNYDNTTREPVVLPTKIPLILVNGAIGIAVGMSTNIPPHNLTEVCDALISRLEDDASVEAIVEEDLPGPDFPLGGEIVEGDIEEIYREGEGTIKIRSEFEVNDQGDIVVTSIPYTTTKEKIIGNIKEAILEDEIPHIKDIRDQSSDSIRILVKLKKGKRPEPAIAYLFDNTDLRKRLHVNLTCLEPKEDGEQATIPRQMNLTDILDHFIDFRMDVIRRWAEYELEQVENRIHRLRAYEAIFGRIDEVVDLLQNQRDRKQAREELQDQFDLDQSQANIILRTPFSQLIEEEVEDKKRELEEAESKKERIEGILSSRDRREELLGKQLRRTRKVYGFARKTAISLSADQYSYDERSLIEEEDAHLILSRNGWCSRQKSYSSIDSLRCQDKDEIGWAVHTNTKASALYMTSAGKIYTQYVADAEMTSGYGSPIQTDFKFSDGEEVVQLRTSDHLDGVELVAVSRRGRAIRFSPDSYTEPSTVRGRTFMRLEDGDEVVNVSVYEGRKIERAVVISDDGRVLCFQPEDISFVKSTAKGRKTIDLEDDQSILAADVLPSEEGSLEVITSNGAERTITQNSYETRSKNDDSEWIIKRGHLNDWRRHVVQID